MVAVQGLSVLEAPVMMPNGVKVTFFCPFFIACYVKEGLIGNEHA